MIRILVLAVATAITCLAATPAVFAQRSYDDRLDIAALLSEAARRFDTSQDVIILSDGQTVTRYPDGRFATTVHRILWVNSYLAIDDCGDVRVPFDYHHCTFTPLAVRTWRDNQWWPSDSSGVVETLPFELEHAYDYAGIREMMLLLNGMGVPCIIEVAYRIEDRTPFRGDADGIWRFARAEAAVESWFEYVAPSGGRVNTAVYGGEAERQSSVDPTTGFERTVWRMTNVPPGIEKHGAEPSADSPHLLWSTWGGWSDLGRLISRPFSNEPASEGALRNAVDSLAGEARTLEETMRLVAERVEDRVTFVDYSNEYWWTDPREADRIYESAYGHAFDRAVLAAAMFRSAGLSVVPLMVSGSPAPVNTDIPSLARLDKLALRVSGDNFSAVYDPTDGSISRGEARLLGRTVWHPASGNPPEPVPAAKGATNVRLDLRFDVEKKVWAGKGFLSGDGGLSPYGKMSGLEDAAEEYLGSLVGSLVENLAIDGFSPERFEEASVVVGFDLSLDSASNDDLGRTRFLVGEPDDGIIDRLGDAVEPFRREVLSTIFLPFPMSQTIEFRVDTTGYAVIHRPESTELKNGAGSFSVTTELHGGDLVVRRRLELEKTVYQPSDWPELRALLLAETARQNATILLKSVESK